MGKTKGPYQEEFPVGTLVRVAPRQALEAFQSSWKLHNPLTTAQLNHGSVVAKVVSVGFYHGGDELYQLENLPGLWHEQCLSRADSAGAV